MTRHDLPAKNAEVRQALYEGTVFQLAATPASKELIALAVALLEEEAGQRLADE